MESIYLELVENSFTQEHLNKQKNQNPYVAYSIEEDKVIYSIKPESPYKMVDLGLPSGLKWADRNVGAETPQDSGLYFSWGNTDGHAVDENGNVTDGYSFDKATYNGTAGAGITAYCILDSTHDAATVNIGDSWRMPTDDEYMELVNAVKSSDGTKGTLTCQYEYIDLNGEQQSLVVYNDGDTSGYFDVEGLNIDGSPIFKTILGVRFTNDATGASVYFPACDNVKGSILSNIGYCGNYWSSSYGGTIGARGIVFYPSKVNARGSTNRYYGLCVRGVRA